MDSNFSGMLIKNGNDWFFIIGILIWILIICGIAFIIVAAILPEERWAFWTSIGIFVFCSLLGGALLSCVLFWRNRFSYALQSAISFDTICKKLFHIIDFESLNSFRKQSNDNKHFFQFCDHRINDIDAPEWNSESFFSMKNNFANFENKKISIWDRNISIYCAEMIHSIEVINYQYLEDLKNNKLSKNETSSGYLLKKIYLGNTKLISVFGNLKSKIPVFGICTFNEATEQIYIFLRGTLTTEEWKKDFQFEQSHHPLSELPKNYQCQMKNVLVHRGFLSMSEKIIEQILESVKAIYKPKSVIISGHSLGGAVASLCSFKLANIYNNLDIFCYTFGKPRVGNDNYQECFNKKINLEMIRFENTEDIVPNLPWPVTPNFDQPSRPYVFLHEGIQMSFTKNIGSLGLNHSITMYQKFLNVIQ